MAEVVKEFPPKVNWKEQFLDGQIWKLTMEDAKKYKQKNLFSMSQGLRYAATKKGLKVEIVLNGELIQTDSVPYELYFRAVKPN